MSNKKKGYFIALENKKLSLESVVYQGIPIEREIFFFLSMLLWSDFIEECFLGGRTKHKNSFFFFLHQVHLYCLLLCCSTCIHYSWLAQFLRFYAFSHTRCMQVRSPVVMKANGLALRRLSAATCTRPCRFECQWETQLALERIAE